MPEPEEREGSEATKPVVDPVVQQTFGPGALQVPAPVHNFDGLGNVNGVYPPDTNGDVGPAHYVQWVNTSLQIFDKNGSSVYGPASGNTLWTGFPYGDCATHNDGDPVVLYDSMADRWLMSQLVLGSTFGECLALSTSGDPLGTYYRYFLPLSTTALYDYPKIGVWPDGYYLTANRFYFGLLYQGPSVIALQRPTMLQGGSVLFVEFGLGSTYSSLLPSDLDGPTLPPDGAPNYVLISSTSSNNLQLWQYHVDWVTPQNSTLTGPATLPVAAYNRLCPNTQNCVPQPGTSVGLDAIGDRLMHRLAYRNFGDHESLVTNQTVDAGGRAGVRWYEVRSPGNTPMIYQQGTYAPDDTNRWMASVAMNGQGDMAMGYSVSSSGVFPGIRYTGRFAGDPLGTMQQEATLINGSGAQTGSGSRWGDYSMMAADPVDDCTFWYTTEYLPTTGTAPWQTRIGAFTLGTCGTPPPSPTPAVATPTATSTATSTSTPVATATDTPTPTSTPTVTPTVTPTSTPASTPTPTLTPGAATFALAVSPTSQTVQRPGQTSYQITLTSVNGYAGTVHLSVSGLPSRTSGTFFPVDVLITPGGVVTSTLAVDAQRTGPTGSYTLAITGSDGVIASTGNVTLVVTR